MAAASTRSLNRRSLGPALGSAVVGVALGVVAILGIAQFSGQDSISGSTPPDDALLGGAEYGSREQCAPTPLTHLAPTP